MNIVIRNNYDPKVKDYCNSLLVDNTQNRRWIFDCNGIFVDVSGGHEDSVLDVILNGSTVVDERIAKLDLYTKDEVNQLLGQIDTAKFVGPFANISDIPKPYDTNDLYLVGTTSPYQIWISINDVLTQIGDTGGGGGGSQTIDDVLNTGDTAKDKYMTMRDSYSGMHSVLSANGLVIDNNDSWDTARADITNGWVFFMDDALMTTAAMSPGRVEMSNGYTADYFNFDISSLSVDGSSGMKDAWNSWLGTGGGGGNLQSVLDSGSTFTTNNSGFLTELSYSDGTRSGSVTTNVRGSIQMSSTNADGFVHIVEDSEYSSSDIALGHQDFSSNQAFNAYMGMSIGGVQLSYSDGMGRFSSLNINVRDEQVDGSDDMKEAFNGWLGDNDYSTSETLTGGKWIDGKAIYRKVMVCDDLPTATSKAYIHGISDLGSIVNVYGYVYDSGNGEPVAPINLSRPDNPTQISVATWVTSTDVSVMTGWTRSGLSATVTIEYTKST